MRRTYQAIGRDRGEVRRDNYAVVRLRHGTAAVEFAIVAPFLLALFLGMCELSRGLMVLHQLSGAARTACRTGIQRDKGNADIIADIQNIMADNSIPVSAVTVTIGVTDPNGVSLTDALLAPAGSIVSVQVSVPVSSVTWVPSLFLSPSMIESEKVAMMKQ
jgi:Flp pilus assembly protein TadG